MGLACAFFKALPFLPFMSVVTLLVCFLAALVEKPQFSLTLVNFMEQPSSDGLSKATSAFDTATDYREALCEGIWVLLQDYLHPSPPEKSVSPWSPMSYF